MSLQSAVRPSTVAGTVLGVGLALAAVPVGAQEPPTASDAGYTVFPVPTSAAGLGNIVTAPNGDMWFVEEDVNKIGRITPSGDITEIALPPTTTGATEGVYDLTVADDGTIWVVFDFGRQIAQVDLAAQTIYHQDLDPSGYPYGEDVEMGPDGVPWVSMSYDDDGLVRVLPAPTGAFWHNNAPPCDGPLGRAHDGGMWCVSFDKLILSNADASGGTTYPLPSNATYPNSLAPGPVGSIWFSRYRSSIYTSPSGGNIGWVDQGTGQVTVVDTGSRTGPRSLVQGPDGAMWFVNRGVGKGIGHLHTDGTGAITKVGDYSPWELTFDHHGFIWFTDPANNSIVRVDPAELQVTDVEVGEGSVFAPLPAPPVPPVPPLPPAPPTPPTIDLPAAPAQQVGKVKVGRKPLRVRRNKVRVPIACPRSADSACRGTLQLLHKKKDRAYSKSTRYRVAPGKRKTVKVRLTKAGKRTVTRKATKVRATLLSPDGGAARHKNIRVRR